MKYLKNRESFNESVESEYDIFNKVLLEVTSNFDESNIEVYKYFHSRYRYSMGDSKYLFVNMGRGECSIIFEDISNDINIITLVNFEPLKIEIAGAGFKELNRELVIDLLRKFFKGIDKRKPDFDAGGYYYE